MGAKCNSLVCKVWPAGLSSDIQILRHRFTLSHSLSWRLCIREQRCMFYRHLWSPRSNYRHLCIRAQSSMFLIFLESCHASLWLLYLRLFPHQDVWKTLMCLVVSYLFSWVLSECHWGTRYPQAIEPPWYDFLKEAHNCVTFELDKKAVATDISESSRSNYRHSNYSWQACSEPIHS